MNIVVLEMYQLKIRQMNLSELTKHIHVVVNVGDLQEIKMGSPNYYSVNVSREAGVFNATIKIISEGKSKAEKEALKIAEKNWNNPEFWKYTEAYFDLVKKPLIQVEETNIE